ncbi:MAG TPA: c-type cytochrome [Ramlibacter sp.]|nr:c-type cytochrome [Ramlibacter sp.]
MRRPIAAMAVACAALPAAAQAPSNEVLGQRLAQSACVQCHTFGKGEPHGAGPNLFGLLGRPAAGVPGYAYTPALAKAVKGQPWDRQLLERFLTDAQGLAPGSGMVYFQDDPRRRQALIDYLASLQ